MTDLAIRVEGLSKRYRIGQRERYLALRDVLARSLTAPLRRLGLRGKELGVNGNSSHSSPLTPDSSLLTPHDSHIWALKDVSFEVKQGEVVGIIGRNGAGKSTLLKILSRITKPTQGYAKIHGRVGSLLEVGTGFHPELTGRENIYLNGAILGMKNAEIKRTFDEIVAFAEVEKFIETPVKFYSSGMYMRLAFAVAAHLEPEILMVDEVLAVGDAEFQKKCLGKMSDVAHQGRTVLFVSHNMAAVEALTSKSLLLVRGRLERYDATHTVVAAYQQRAAVEIGVRRTFAGGNGGETGTSVGIIDRVELKVDGMPTDSVPMGASVTVELSYHYDGKPEGVMVGIGIDSYSGSRIVSVNSLYDSGTYLKLQRRGSLVCDLGCLPLNPGIYRLKLGLETSTGVNLLEIREALSFEIVEADVHKKGFATRVQKGIFFWTGSWRFNAEA